MEAKRVEELDHHSKTQRHTAQRTGLGIHVLKKGPFSGLRQVRPLLLLQWALTGSHSPNHSLLLQQHCRALPNSTRVPCLVLYAPDSQSPDVPRKLFLYCLP